jgi:multifunctional methyltransferase subunit TRM112
MDGVVVAETLYSKQFMLHIMKTIDYPALCQTTKEVSGRRSRWSSSARVAHVVCLMAQLNHPEVPILPDAIPDDLSNADELLQLIHRVIFDVRARGKRFVRLQPASLCWSGH